jgi:hypothetical protein
MPKARLHWACDVLLAASLAAVAGMVFWLLPP